MPNLDDFGASIAPQHHAIAFVSVGSSLPVRTFADAIDIACLVGGINPAADDKIVFCESHYRHVAENYSDLVRMIAAKRIVFVDSIIDLTRQAACPPGAQNHIAMSRPCVSRSMIAGTRFAVPQ